MKRLLLSCAALSFVYASQEVQVSKLSDNVDLRNYKEIQKRETKIRVDSNLSDVDGVYNYSYSPNETGEQERANVLLTGNFDRIHRYDSLYLEDGNLTESSQKTFETITEQIHNYVDDASREIVVSIIAYTQKVENKNQEVALESAYTNFFQKIAQRDDLDPKVAQESATHSLEYIYKKMLDDNISEEIIYRENRIGKDALYSEEFAEGRARNNRVDVAIYVKEILDPDTDGDGVHDSKDYCQETPLGASVDKNGCPLIMSLDLKFDFDKATISDELSLQDIQKLSDFMKKYPAYHANIVGHTDNVGRAEYNKKLSIKRAEVVREYLIADGVNPSRLSYEGRGASEPLFENINPFNRHKNRRTEVELTLPEVKKERVKPQPRRRGLKD